MTRKTLLSPLFDQEFDGNAHELFSGTALVDPRQPLYVLPAEKLRQRETGQARTSFAARLKPGFLNRGTPPEGTGPPDVAAHNPVRVHERRACTPTTAMPVRPAQA